MNVVGFNQVMPWAMGHPPFHGLQLQLGNLPFGTLSDDFSPFDEETLLQDAHALQHLLQMHSWPNHFGANMQVLQALQQRKWIYDLIRCLGPKQSRRYYSVKNHYGIGPLGGLNVAQMGAMGGMNMANAGGPGGLNMGNMAAGGLGGGAMGMAMGGVHPHAIGGVYHPGMFALMGSPFSWLPNNAPMYI